MKKLIIRNLRACFESNVTFTRLAEFEQMVFKSKDIIQVIIIENDRLIFKNAKINEKQEMVIYYEYSYMPF